MDSILQNVGDNAPRCGFMVIPDRHTMKRSGIITVPVLGQQHNEASYKL